MDNLRADDDELGVGLDSLLPATKPKRKNALIREHFEKIDAALKRGVSFEQIRDYLDGKGVDIGITTLRQYVSEARAKAAKPVSKRMNAAMPRKPRQSKTRLTAQDARPATPGTDRSKFVNIPDEGL
ncbi:MAG: hypothetical protein HQL44_09310 [Alphaproteobacteria bacterium]|nr:hypothetical protein [Alphaproteobacteria bacterium]